MFGGATWFDDHFTQAASEIINFLADEGVLLSGLDVADVGAGDGIIDLAIALRESPASLVGFDINPVDVDHLVREARAHGVAEGLPPNLHFVRSEIFSLPTETASFDAVFTWSAFEHVADPTRLLGEIKRVLRPDGFLFLQLWPFYYSEHGGHLWEWFPDETFVALRRPPDEVAAAIRGNPQGDPHWAESRLHDFRTLNRLTLNGLQRALLEAGFAIRKVELLSNVFNLPEGIDREFPLTDLAISGVKLLATDALRTDEAIAD
jgi:SAM-dependent methyltransferase